MSLEIYDYSVRLDDDVVLQVRHYRRGQSRPTLVLLHEALGNIALWRTFPEKLCERTGLDVLVYERRGYGSSTPMTLPRGHDYHEQEGKLWLPCLLEALNLEQVVLIGHSDGGSIALVAAAAIPEKIVGLVTMAAHIYVDHLTQRGIHEAYERYQTTDLHKRLARYHGDRTDLLFRAWVEPWLDESFQNTLNLRPWLACIKCPALIIQGANDNYGLPQQVKDIVQGIGSLATPDIIPDCGHNPHLEQQNYCIKKIAAFIDNCLSLQFNPAEV